MLTRLKVSGFKNLVDVDVSFGPFTCVAGANGVGKSNLFDAITFLSALASDTLLNAALSVRDVGGRTADVRSLFHRVGDTYADRISFEAEMIVPSEGIDDLGQHAEAKITFLHYAVELGYRVDEALPTLGSLELLRESLDHIRLSDAVEHLKFEHSAGRWRNSVVKGRSTSPFISTREKEGEVNVGHVVGDKGPQQRVINLHQDGNQGRPKSFLAANLPRTVLSTVNATESPTALMARREMQSWRLLQLEPSALREPDRFTTPPGLGSNGSHLPATLYYLARTQKTNGQGEDHGETWVYDQIVARLAQLIDDVYQVRVDKNDKRELLTLEVSDFRGTPYPARSLSDGTLRFLALAVLELDPKAGGLICLEEPENGFHPERIPGILRLLQDIATDVTQPVGLDNPLRQVIINTHSPAVVAQVPADSLLVAELKETVQGKHRFRRASFSWLPKTWRAEARPDIPTVARGRLLAYLNPVAPKFGIPGQDEKAQPKRPRVIDHPDLQPMLPLASELV
jgi:predicted ATPase